MICESYIIINFAGWDKLCNRRLNIIYCTYINMTTCTIYIAYRHNLHMSDHISRLRSWSKYIDIQKNIIGQQNIVVYRFQFT